MNYYKGEVDLKITLNTVANIAAASVRRIRYRKPDGTKGSWAAEQEDATHISYTTTSPNDLDQAGVWEFESYIERGKWKIPGDRVCLRIDEPITTT